MRFVPTFCLKEGMVLGRSLYNNNGGLLLKEGSVIHKSYIDKIIEIGFQGIYIEDDISKNVEIQEVVNHKLRIDAIQQIKSMFIGIENEKYNVDNDIYTVGKTVEKLVDELIRNKNLMVNMIDIKSFDDYTFSHSVNVAVLSIIIGVALKLNREELYKLGKGALLHDIGKVFVSKDILNKNDKLTDSEFEEMKGHSLYGYNYLKTKYEIPAKSYVAVLEHHEKFDGTGYPKQKEGKDISLFGRIIAIADVYDALASKRTYRDALLPSEVMEYIMGGAGTHFDYDLVNIFTRSVAAYPIGMCVELSNGLDGIVVENYPDACTRPKVKIIGTEVYINLKDDFESKDITIVGIANI